MSYVDGFLVPVPKAKIDEYIRISEIAKTVWMEHGALEYVECVGDDVPDGQHTSFPMSVKLEAEETVIFSWIRYSSREERDRILALVMADPRLKDQMSPETMPFDGKRMMFGGFKVVID
tara:strand:+ start:774 stop:1130 length:357 start_codon:yes stop_codon:yes gene_type:complete